MNIPRDSFDTHVCLEYMSWERRSILFILIQFTNELCVNRSVNLLKAIYVLIPSKQSLNAHNGITDMSKFKVVHLHNM